MSGAGVADLLVRPITRTEVDRFSAELDAHHWLGHRLTGQVMRYVAVLDGQWVALVGFGSAVLHCAARDRFVGWSLVTVTSSCASSVALVSGLWTASRHGRGVS